MIVSVTTWDSRVLVVAAMAVLHTARRPVSVMVLHVRALRVVNIVDLMAGGTLLYQVLSFLVLRGVCGDELVLLLLGGVNDVDRRCVLVSGPGLTRWSATTS